MEPATRASEPTSLVKPTPHEPAGKSRRLIPESDRRPVTIIFADVVGSTSLAEEMDPEEWRSVISLAFGRVAPVIHLYEGTIAQVLGDALLIYFGAPVAHEDDPARAIRAALELLDVVREVGIEIESRFSVQLQMRVGINTGLAVVGDLKTDLGSDLASNYLALGDAVNLAARIESVAEPMTVFVSDDTHLRTAPLFDWEDRGTFELKGKREPVHLWQATGRHVGQTTLRGFVGMGAPMVGREAELDRLLQATAALERDWKGAIVTVTGEPGIGKTRLVSEWRAQAVRATDMPAWFTASCVSHGRRLAYHAIVGLLRSAIGAGEAAKSAETRARLSDAVARHLDGSPEASAVLADFLSLSLQSEEQETMQALDSQARLDRYVRTMSDLLRHEAEERPTVTVIEDVHWADPTSVFVLRRLLPLAAEAPILFCLTSRPEVDAPAWPVLSEVRSITDAPVVAIELDRLARDATGALVHALLDAAGIVGADETGVLAHAEGNPFFAEELVRMLIEAPGKGAVPLSQAFEGNIPASIHGLLLARLDALPTAVRNTARVAAVVGRRFSAHLLEEVDAG